MAYDPIAYKQALAEAASAYANCRLLCETDYCFSVCTKEYEAAVAEANALFNTEESTVYGTIKDNDLLVVGRGDTSYQVPLSESGLATLSDAEAAEQGAKFYASELFDAEKKDREDADAAEAEARALADNTESEARIAADTAEAEAREASDTALETLILNSLDFALYDELP